MNLSPVRLIIVALLLAAVFGSRAHAQRPTGVVTYAGARTTVTLTLPTLRNPAEERARLSELIVGCRRIIDVTPSDSAALLSRLAPPLDVQGVPAEDVVELTIMPSAGLPVSCGDRTRNAGLIEERAQWISFDSLVPPDRRIVRVNVTNSARAITPLATSRVTLRRLGPAGYSVMDASALRIAIRVGDLALDSLGTEPRLVIEVIGEGESAPDRIVVEWNVLRDVWDDLLPARARALRGAQPSLEFPQPDDSRLREAHTAYLAGDARRATELANTRLARGGLSRDDNTWVRALSAATFGAGHDTLATQVSLEMLSQGAPCLRWSEHAPALVLSLSRELPTPDNRCESISTRRVIARSLVLPGFGRVREARGDYVRQAAVAGAFVGTAVFSQVLRQRTRTKYDQYLAAQYVAPSPGVTPPDVTALFDDARQTQRLGKAMVYTSVAVYVAQVGYSVWAERRFERRLRSISTYGEPRASRVGLRVEARANLVALAMEWTW